MSVSFSVISAMNALYYRMFIVNYDFGGMELKDITRLAEMELGREGKKLAKDPKNHKILAAKIQQRLQSDADSLHWQEECGINHMVDALDKCCSLRISCPS